MKKQLKEFKGITLIALVITIIVLLILAGISISMLSGDNGILIKAQNAKTQTKDAEVEERVKLVLAQWPLEKYQGTKGLEEYLRENFGEDNVTYDEETKQYTMIVDGYEAIIDSEGKIVGDIQKAGPRPVVDDESIEITLENGSEITEEQNEGTKLKIKFTASIENGTITGVEKPSGATLGENGEITYITNGTEKEITFKIVGTVEGETYKTPKTISVADKYKIDHSEVIVSTITVTGNFANNSNIKEVREGNIPVPTGYTYVKGDKIGGAVITDGTSEFVWIPVDTISEMASTDIGGTDANGNTNYRGVLYDFKSDPDKNTKIAWSANSTKNREPANLSSSYDNANNVQGWSATLYQEEYNKMVKQVAKYGGFYVGRYETSLNNATADDFGDGTSTYVQSKAGVKSAKMTLKTTYMWYGLYKMSKTYAPESDTSKSVVSSMIWGSQYDAMMRWMQKNDIDVTSESSTKLQNAVRNSSDKRITGASDSLDKLNNIYDIWGNSYEWTLEANDTYCRVIRGGYYYTSYSPSHRGDYEPANDYGNGGSRLTLYIK